MARRCRPFSDLIPRGVLLPEPFQIFQSADRVVIVYQHVHAYRVIFTDGRPHYDDGIEFYMGDSRGRWEGNTLVVDVTNFKPETWLDGAGHFPILFPAAFCYLNRSRSFRVRIVS